MFSFQPRPSSVSHPVLWTLANARPDRLNVTRSQPTPCPPAASAAGSRRPGRAPSPAVSGPHPFFAARPLPWPLSRVTSATTCLSRRFYSPNCFQPLRRNSARGHALLRLPLVWAICWPG